MIPLFQSDKDFRFKFERAFKQVCEDKIIVLFTKSSVSDGDKAHKTLPMSRKIKKKRRQRKKKSESKREQPESKESAAKIFRVNFVLLRHLLRSEFLAKSLSSEDDEDYISVVETVLSSSLNFASWKNSANEHIDIRKVLEVFGESDYRSKLGSQIQDYLLKLCAEHEEYFSMREENLKILVKTRDLILNLQTEFLENFIGNKLGKEALRVLKSADLLKGRTQQHVQEFCLIQSKVFKKIVIDLVKLNLICKSCSWQSNEEISWSIPLSKMSSHWFPISRS